MKDKDKGWGNVFRTFDQLKKQKPRIVVGLTGKSATAKHADGDGLTVVEIGAVHEFGAGVPKRSFIRSTFDANQGKYVKAMVTAAGEIVGVSASGGVATSSIRESRALKRLALKMEGDVKQAIANGIPPPNAPATVARKGSSRPLIASGQMRAAVTSEIRTGEVVK